MFMFGFMTDRTKTTSECVASLTVQKGTEKSMMTQFIKGNVNHQSCLLPAKNMCCSGNEQTKQLRVSGPKRKASMIPL